MNKIFLDNNSTTPLDPKIMDKMIPFFLEKFGNPSSRTHSYGWEAEAYVEKSREKIALLINAQNNEIIFTSGATESNNIAIINIIREFRNSHIITMESEHKAILDVCNHLEQKGVDISYIRPKSNGIVDINDIIKNIKKNTKLISIMHANNEIGVIQPIKEIGSICREKNIFFHVDGAQSLAKIEINVKKMNIDLLSLSSHKIYGPKGIGALYIDSRIKNFKSIYWGGNQERGLRPGTLPVPLIVGFGEACKIANNSLKKESKKILTLRNTLLDKLKNDIKDLIINGDIVNRIPGNINLSFPSLRGQSIIAKLPNIAVSSGSACTSSSPKPSHVLLSIGLNKRLINSSIRLGIGRFNNVKDIETASKEIVKAVKMK